MILRIYWVLLVLLLSGVIQTPRYVVVFLFFCFFKSLSIGDTYLSVYRLKLYKTEICFQISEKKS